MVATIRDCVRAIELLKQRLFEYAKI